MSPAQSRLPPPPEAGWAEKSGRSAGSLSKPGPRGVGKKKKKKTPCAVRFREQAAPEQVFFPTRGRTSAPWAAGSKIRDADQGSALDARWEQLQGPRAAQAASLLRRRASGGSGGFSSRCGGLQRQPLQKKSRRPPSITVGRGEEEGADSFQAAGPALGGTPPAHRVGAPRVSFGVRERESPLWLFLSSDHLHLSALRPVLCPLFAPYLERALWQLP